MVTLEITSKTGNWYRHLPTFEVVIPYVDSVSTIYVYSVYVLTNNFITVLFKGRCRRGDVKWALQALTVVLSDLW
jgi:hypothetical protein